MSLRGNQGSMQSQQLTILGSTGSIGVSTLDVVAQHRDTLTIFALTANTSIEKLADQCQIFHPKYAVVGDHETASLLETILKKNNTQQPFAEEILTEVLYGPEALSLVASHDDVDTVMAAIVGAAGLLPTMSAVRSGKKVLLANKEALVMAGQLFMNAVAESGAHLLPIDSEHNAIFQCLPQPLPSLSETKAFTSVNNHVQKIILTGSGGPFRVWSKERIDKATPEQACKHPNWSMGKKISVDSASLMNKGLEFIEAKWLFDVDPSMIDVLIHPQSIIHSMVEYIDGSVLAQLGNPDMRTPIAYGLAYPERITSGVSSLDMLAAARLDFEAPDMHRFPALSLAIDAADAGIGATTTLNAANEVAVASFLNGDISFGQITQSLVQVMNSMDWGHLADLDDVMDLDAKVRRMSNQYINLLRE